MEVHPNVVARERQEKVGGWLPLYIVAEECVVTGATLRCFYCGFGFGDGHDFACRYVSADVQERHKFQHEILVPKGGLPPSRSFF